MITLNAGGLKTRTEEVTQDGRIDLVIEMRNLVYILELKVDKSAEQAIQHIKDKDYARKYRNPGVVIWAIGISLAGRPKGETKQTENATGQNAVRSITVEAL